LVLIGPGLVGAAEKPVTVAYVEWSTEIASSNLVKAVIQERLGQPCVLKAMPAEEMWRSVAEGEADAMVSAWLPGTQAHYYKRFKDGLVNLGPNLKGTKIGLVVPNMTEGRLTAGTGIRNRPYITVDSIPELKKHADKLKGRIVGIDPGAGIMNTTRQAMQAYNLHQFRLIEGSEVSMVAELSHAIRHQQWIVVTGWLPHWIFARWELKFLEDPKNIYSDKGHINTMVRRGLKEDRPEVYAFLDRFHWKPEEMGQLMLWIQQDKGLYPYEKALRWIRTNPDRVQDWLGEE
jgi:glycine betaine/proline transport system substrate-binding protein